MSDIKVVRLSTGEELIATVHHSDFNQDGEIKDTDLLMLEDVAILIPTEANSLGLAPFMAYTDAHKKTALMGKDVMFMANPVDGLKQQYQTMFGKIATPSQKIIT
jgi:hypothetical protein